MIVIADDLTGAADAAAGFLKLGYSVAVAARSDGDFSDAGRFGVFSVNTDSRELDGHDAYQRVFEITRAFKGQMIYKKIDSIFRGNPAEELEAVIDGANFDIAIVSSSFPENKRTTLGGILRASGIEIDAVSLFEGNMRRRVGLIPIDTVRRGAEAVAKYAETEFSRGVSVFVADSETREDLATLAFAAKYMDKNILYCGSARLAEHILEKNSDKAKSDIELPRGKGIIVAIGSRTEVTRRQIEYANQKLDIKNIIMPVDAVLKNPETETKKYAAMAAEELEKKGEAVICFDSLFKDFDLLAKQDDSEKADAERIAKVLAATVSVVREKIPVFGLITSGGDASLAVMKVMKADTIELIAEVSPGIPAGKMRSNTAAESEELPVIVTKSGGFGNVEAIAESVEFLKNLMSKKEQRNG